MKMLKAIITVTMSITLSGCGALWMPPPEPTPAQPHRYSHKNASFDQFLKDRYECLKDTEQRQSQAYANGNASQYGANYGGSASSTVRPTCSAFNACLAARGYLEDPNGKLEVPTSLIVDCIRFN